jgi:hypothetical protein
MLSRSRPSSGETEVPPEALSEPASGHAAVQGGGSTVVGVASYVICGGGGIVVGAVTEAELGRGRVFSKVEARLRARQNSLPRVRPCPNVRMSCSELLEYNKWRGGAVVVILAHASSQLYICAMPNRSVEST